MAQVGRFGKVLGASMAEVKYASKVLTGTIPADSACLGMVLAELVKKFGNKRVVEVMNAFDREAYLNQRDYLENAGKVPPTELIFVRYTVEFRQGMVFAESLKRNGRDAEALLRDYRNIQERCANAYNHYPENQGASVMWHQIGIVSISDGWR